VKKSPKVDKIGREIKNGKLLCCRYDRSIGRWCRNVSMKQEGSYGICRKHTIQDLKDFELKNPKIIWYLENRHLLKGDTNE
jgi:hypothetical protein